MKWHKEKVIYKAILPSPNRLIWKRKNKIPRWVRYKRSRFPAIDAGHLYPNGAERMAYMILDRDNKETRVISEMIEDGPVRRMTFVEPKLANRPAFLRGHDST